MQIIEPNETGRLAELRTAATHAAHIQMLRRWPELAAATMPPRGFKALLVGHAELRDWSALLAEGHHGVTGGAR